MLKNLFTASWAKKFSLIFTLVVIGFCLIYNICAQGISAEWVAAAGLFMSSGIGAYLGGKALNGGLSSMGDSK